MAESEGGWDAPIVRERQGRRRPLAAEGQLSVDQAFEAFLHHEDYAETTRTMMRDYVSGRRGRGWREANGCTALADFTAKRAVDFLDWYRDDIGAMKETVRKVRNHLRKFARWTALPPERGGLGLDSLSRPPLTTYEVRRLSRAEREERPDQREEAPPLTSQEVKVLVKAAAKNPRDQLIVELLAYTGMRPSELCGLTVGSFDLKGRPPLVRITGSIHDAGVTKTAAGNRDLPLTIFQNTLPDRVRTWIESQRPDAGSIYLVNSERKDRLGHSRPLTTGAVTLMLVRLENLTGIHANPYRFRHSFCTWYAEGGGEPFHLMYLMGHSSLAMVARYFRGRLNKSLMEAASRVRI